MSLWQDFKTFALKGNMIDMAVGIIIGAAFTKIVSSLVSDIIMPPLGLLIGGIDFSQFMFKMHIPGTSKEPVDLKYGAFLNNLIDFLIIAILIFAIIKVVNRFRKVEDSEAVKTKDCPECLMSIPINAKKCGHCCSILNPTNKI